jgi:nicotinamide riboside kinase
MLSIKERFSAVKEKFQTQFHEKKEIALKDWRYLEAEEKRQRFDQELSSSLARVNRHWEVLEELETQWKHRAASVPEIVYVEVNEAG